MDKILANMSMLQTHADILNMYYYIYLLHSSDNYIFHYRSITKKTYLLQGTTINETLKVYTTWTPCE